MSGANNPTPGHMHKRPDSVRLIRCKPEPTHRTTIAFAGKDARILGHPRRVVWACELRWALLRLGDWLVKLARRL